MNIIIHDNRTGIVNGVELNGEIPGAGLKFTWNSELNPDQIDVRHWDNSQFCFAIPLASLESLDLLLTLMRKEIHKVKGMNECFERNKESLKKKGESSEDNELDDKMEGELDKLFSLLHGLKSNPNIRGMKVKVENGEVTEIKDLDNLNREDLNN